MKKLSFADNCLIWITTILLGLFLAKYLAIYGIKLTMKKYPELYTEKSLNQFGFSKEKKQ